MLHRSAGVARHRPPRHALTRHLADSRHALRADHQHRQHPREGAIRQAHPRAEAGTAGNQGFLQRRCITCTKPRPRTTRTSTAPTVPRTFGTQPHMAERTRTRTAHHLDPVLRSHACMRLPCVLMLYTAEWRGPLGILLREWFATSEYFLLTSR